MIKEKKEENFFQYPLSLVNDYAPWDIKFNFMLSLKFGVGLSWII